MHFSNLLWCLAMLLLGNGVLSHPYHGGLRDIVHKRSYLFASRQPFSNTRRQASATQPHLMLPDPAKPKASAPNSTSSALSSASSTVAHTQYIILAAQDATGEQIQYIKNILLINTSPESLEEVTSKRTGLVAFFVAAMSSSQADAIAKLPGVGSVAPDVRLKEDQPLSLAPLPLTSRQAPTKGSHGPPQTTLQDPAVIRLQPGAAEELKVISQPPGSWRDELPGFGYASEAGKGVTIYVIDSGANSKHPEWTSMTGSKDFMYVDGAVQEETDYRNHGSCIASKATGLKYGTAKEANIVMVKLPEEWSLLAITKALVMISNDVTQKGIRGKAVINMSFRSLLDKSDISTFKQVIVDRLAEDIIIVTSSGNKKTVSPKVLYNTIFLHFNEPQANKFKGSRLDKVSDYPALFGKTTDIIVVGAVDNVGIRATNSLGTGKELTTSAPGRGKCASGDSSGSKQSSGTSFAAASVAGVIAVWLSQDEYRTRLQVSGKVATNVKAMVKSLSYPRIRRGPPVIWNGVDPRRFARPPKPQWSKKPQGFQRVYERDNVESGIYVATSNSASEGVTDNIEQWCLDKCIGESTPPVHPPPTM
ncbi:Alkaline proteinase [Colletotrichum higginsianum IMI 349063]|uniref:Alkaline proteinase n=1 Tax=Colletotrichum higginsianum (strain IMI 349063) TaxID=759273 RepID=A0A1B7YGQ1_COLHI|nr:Alkaline proteinase [Colletotrichum higginsianum IMI 349063]OBR11253.1 Alkaline proteinase [Colletotrichum higginsianum IMI 349063]